MGWPLFFVISLLLHLLVLLLWPASPLPLAEQTSATSLAVTLESGTAEHTAQPTAPAKPATPPTPQRRVRSSQQPQESIPTPAAPRPDLAAMVATVATPDTQTSLTGNSVRFLGDSQSLAFDAPPAATEADSDTISAQIRTRFADHFVYPLLAQRNDWEGEVLLGFHVASDGTLSDIQVIRSSGYTLLDEAALASMRAIGRIEFSSGVILHRTLELRMPVVYHLAQG